MEHRSTSVPFNPFFSNNFKCFYLHLWLQIDKFPENLEWNTCGSVFHEVKNPCFKDPMRFLFWTFLDILKMSIFGFLEEMFFCRTEKTGMIKNINVRTENGKENITITFGIFNIFGK